MVSVCRPYTEYTYERYNGTVDAQVGKKPGRLRNLMLLSAVAALAFPAGPQILDALDAVFYSVKLSWIFPVPYFILQDIGSQVVLTPELAIDPMWVSSYAATLSGKRIIYTITTKGNQLTTLEESVRSTLYWLDEVKARYYLEFVSEVWVVTEEDSFTEHSDFYSRLEMAGARVIAVPGWYKTPNLTGFKARALQYACEVRIAEGIDTPSDWVYHQDTETVVGEDTILGNLDFILRADSTRLLGIGIILYPQDWAYRFNSVEETARSSGDIAAMGQMKLWGTSPFGYHGSHFLVRADVENSVGWDFGKVRSEDLIFGIKVQDRYGPIIRNMKGFAYEMPPLSFHDQLKQRRRWVTGSIEALRRKDICRKRKLPIIYGAASWLSALPSIAAAILSFVHPTGGFIPYLGGAITGLLWWSMYSGYRVGYELHAPYLDGARGRWDGLRLAYSAFIGLLVDAIAPWYAVFSRTKGYDEIRKDKPLPIAPMLGAAPRSTPDRRLRR